MSHSEFTTTSYTSAPKAGMVTWKAPSNIALVKYWGKYGLQLPKNASLSFTLSTCATTTTIRYTPLETKAAIPTFDVSLDGKPAPDFRPKIADFFDRIARYIPLVHEYHFSIETKNSFPHSSGIASSASGMSALAVCLMDLERQRSETMSDALFRRKASFLARLGSGSASRSVEGPLVVWGTHEAIPGSSQDYGIPFPFKVHAVFETYQDTILLVDKGEKVVSSTVGHNLMNDHPYADARFKQAQMHMSRLTRILMEGDLKAFVNLVEREALTLHAMMMASDPYFILMKPNTLEIINRVWAYRKEQDSQLCFTLDAGANVHLLYPKSEKEAVRDFIARELATFCKNGEYIHDETGHGAEPLEKDYGDV